MWSPIPLSLFLLLVLAQSAHAANFPFRVRTTTPLGSGSLHARASISGQVNSTNNSVPIHNTRNAEYISNITLGGLQIPVLLDTGSSDLWVTGNVPQTTDLGKSASLSYAVGNAAGDINTADLEFNGNTIKNQAYLLVKDTSSFSVDIKSQGFEGLIGLGPNTGSLIRKKVDDSTGDSVLSRIFSQNMTSANYLTLLLDRSGDPGDPFTGQMTVSEPVKGFENITSMPTLPVETVHKLTDEDQHWQTYTDANGIIGPDGQPIQIKSIVPKAPSNQLVVVFDSGYTLPQVPRALSDAIYGRVQGAEYNTDSGVWTVPCNQPINLTFVFGGVQYPIHPLDTSSSDFNMVNSIGSPVCVGAFQPITSAFSLLGEYDIILGMAFMRNAYMLFDYGDWVDDSSQDRNAPFVQMLPLTNAAAAHRDFVQVRMNGVDTSGDPSFALLPKDQQKSSPVSAAEKKKMYEELVLSRWPYIFVGCLIFVLLVIGLITWRCCVARKRRNATKLAAQAMGGIVPGGAKPHQMEYKPLEEGGSPVPMRAMGGEGGRYDDDPYAYPPYKV